MADLAALRDRGRRLLAVFPHPDDEAYGPAGTLARAAAHPDGAAVLLCLTRGEATTLFPGRTPDDIAALREGRLGEVARILGLQGLVVGSLPDGRLSRCALDELAAPIAEVLDAFAPHVVIAHDPRGVNAHPDHVAAHWALRHALVGRRPGVRLAMLAYPPEAAEAVKPRLLFPTPPEEIDVVVRLTRDETLRKEATLRVHEALVTVVENGPPALLYRPPVERYDLLGESFAPPLDDLFARL